MWAQYLYPLQTVVFSSSIKLILMWVQFLFNVSLKLGILPWTMKIIIILFPLFIKLVLKRCDYSFPTLVEFSNLTLNTIESNYHVNVIYKDFRKTFDRLSHCILIRKVPEILIFIHQCFIELKILFEWS